MKSSTRFELTPIAYVYNYRVEIEDDNWGDVLSVVELVPDVPPETLAGLADFSHAEILFLFDQVDPSSVNLSARHPRNNRAWPKVGIFAQRAKGRPNRLGSTIVRVLSVDERKLTVQGLDAINGTPILDIKPVMQEFLPREAIRQPEWSHELMRGYWKKP
jgi:tRNA-Thr(GGU) m(6)t(6)A37 methyltransferase TsaA